MSKDNSLEKLEIENAYRYCESVTKAHAKSFYFAAKFLPKHKQKAVFPIYAFCRHVDDEIDEIKFGDEEKAIAAVEEWKRNLSLVYEGKLQNFGQNKSEDSPLGKVFLAWKNLLETYKIPQHLPLELIKGVLMDTQIKRYQTFKDLYVYCFRVASTVGLMSSEILGYTDKKALEYAEAMGVAMQLTNILRDIGEDAAINRIYIPQEDLQKFEISESRILNGEFDENFAEMMRFQIARARRFYQIGEKGIGLLKADSRFTVLLASRTYARILDRIEEQNYNIFVKRAHTTTRQKIFSIPKIWRESKKMRG